MFAVRIGMVRNKRQSFDSPKKGIHNRKESATAAMNIMSLVESVVSPVSLFCCGENFDILFSLWRCVSVTEWKSICLHWIPNEMCRKKYGFLFTLNAATQCNRLQLHSKLCTSLWQWIDNKRHTKRFVRLEYSKWESKKEKKGVKEWKRKRDGEKF